MKKWLIVSVTAFTVQIAAAQSVPSELSGYSFEIHEDVPSAERDLVLSKMAEAHRYFERFGIGLSDKQRKRFVIKIVATGMGNQERGGGGGCCTSQSETNRVGPRLFFDTGHKHWPRKKDRKSAIVFHEYTHGIQSSLGVKSWDRSLMGDWMEEGMAEYYAHDLASKGRKSRLRKIEKRVFEWARNGEVFKYSLKQLEPNNRPTHPGNLGYLAVAGLVETSKHGKSAPLIYMQLLRKGGRDRAFAEAFGIERSEFYSRFNSWQDAVRRGQTRVAIWSRF